MAGEYRILRITTDGYPAEISPSGGTAIETPGILLGGDIVAGGTHSVTGLAAGDADGDALSFGQSGANLAGLSIDTSPLNMNGQAINDVAAPSGAGDATNKAYVDAIVIGGGPVKEPLFDAMQMSDAEGILAGEALYFTAQPAVGDHVKIDDGTNSENYVFVANIVAEAGPLDVSRESSAATALNRLMIRINAGSAYWKGVYEATAHADIHTPCAFIYDQTTDASPSTSRIYAPTQGNANLMLVPFTSGTTTLVFLPYTYKTAGASLATDPGYRRFGLNRDTASLTDGEIHLDLGTDNLYSWNGDASTWFQMSGPGSIPLATAASGGGVVGRVGFDKDYGLDVTVGGIAKVTITPSMGLQFHPAADADKGKLEILLAGTHRLIQGVAGLDVEGLPLSFWINGVQVSANFTAAAATELTGGGATTLHSHAGATAAQNITNNFTTTGACAKGDPMFWSSTNNKIDVCDAATDGKQWAIGVAMATLGVAGTVDVVSNGHSAAAVLPGAVTAGMRIFLAAGHGLTKTAPVGSGNHVMQMGFAENAADLFVQIQYMGKKA
jgi:hypothetical protein